MRSSSKNFNSQSFISEVEKLLEGYSSKVFRTSASDSSKWSCDRFENRVILKTRKLDDLIALSLISYYLPEIAGWSLRISIEEIVDKNPELSIVHFLLQGKGLCWLFLCDTKLWSIRDFFGNILSKSRLEQLGYMFEPKLRSNKSPKRVQRHRGYRDKGSLKFSHEYHSFVDFTKEMNELEQSRQSREDTLAFIRGFLE